MSVVPAPRHAAPSPSRSVADYVDEAALAEVLAAAWAAFVDADGTLEPVTPAAVPAGDGPAPAMVAEVAVHGAVPARVSVGMDTAGAEAVARRMVAGTGLPACEDDVADAMGELANVLGGNLKALLPEGSTLTLPSVVERDHLAAGSGDAVLVTAARWGDHLVTATVTPFAQEDRP